MTAQNRASRILAALAAALLLAILAPAAHSETATATFIMPQNFDPTRVTFTSLNTPRRVTGAMLLPENGVELHARIPGSTAGAYRHVIQVQMRFTFPGEAVQVRSASGISAFQAWQASTVRDGNDWTITFTAVSGAAPMNDALFLRDDQGTLHQSSALVFLTVDTDPRNESVDNVTFTATQAEGEVSAPANIVPPAFSVKAPSTVKGPPRYVSVTIQGTVKSPNLALYSGRCQVIDDYGLHQPAKSVVFTKIATGQYSFRFSLSLDTRLQAGDADGRQYAVVLTARDRDWDIGTAHRIVLVPPG